MTSSQQKTPQMVFLERLAALAKLCQTPLSPETVGLYDKALRSLGYDSLSIALEEIILNRRGTDRFPSVADLRQKVCPQADDNDLAIEAANRVIQAVSQIGQYRWSDARDFIGEIGEYIVERCGGWSALCLNFMAKDTGVFRAQFRELALAGIRRARLGLSNEAPRFPRGGQGALQPTRVDALIGNVTNKLSGGNTNGQEQSPPRSREHRGVPRAPGAERVRTQGDS